MKGEDQLPATPTISLWHVLVEAKIFSPHFLLFTGPSFSVIVNENILYILLGFE